MSDTAIQTDSQTEAESDHAAYKEAAIELGKGIALGLVPVLGQAIDAYDTVESAIALYQSKAAEDKENAQFDLLLALVGWLPGPGDGVKKSLHIVNHNPDRFAPVLFDLLRFVLSECGIKTSPEALLGEIFNAEKLKAQLDSIRQGVEDASSFKALPDSMQSAVKGTLTMASTNMPILVGVVEKRLKKWRGKQRNSSAQSPARGSAKNTPPEATHPDTATHGKDGGSSGHANTSINEEIAEKSLEGITNEMVGISGEHIADYICANDFGWGEDWKGHDDGEQGRWKQGTPSASKLGKLSKGGNPKSPHILYKLSDGANGTGIDAVWRAEGKNGGKPYAVVEAKASRDEDAKKFGRKIKKNSKPSIISKLGTNVISDASDLLEPLEDEDPDSPKVNASASGKAGGKRGGGKASGKSGGATNAHANPPNQKSGEAKNKKDEGGVKDVVVQMSHAWIEANVQKAVSDPAVLADFKRLVRNAYSRHLFFAPAYHPSGSPKDHMLAKLKNLPEDQHTKHDAFHYDESEVRAAVNKRKASLRKKHGEELSSLKAE